jgi:hypothetical protein
MLLNCCDQAHLVILNAVKNLVLYRNVSLFLWGSVAEGKVVLEW